MITKLTVVLLLLQNILQFTNGQVDPKFFRQDYTYIDGTDSFYKMHTLQKNWEDAKAKCESEGAALFYPEDYDEASAVIAHWNATQPNFYKIFIGVADWNVKEVFETIDSRPISAVYNNWGPGEPNNHDGNEGCLVLYKHGTLNDDKCHKKYPFVCKKTLATLQWNRECNIPDIRYVYNNDLRKCYKFHLTPRNWTDAYALCNAEESYLAIINNEKERDYLVSMIASAPLESVTDSDFLYGGVHLGFQCKKGWMTIKGVPLQESGYSRWANGQPDGVGTENCGSMFFSGELNDISCSQKMFFICEHDVVLQSAAIELRF